MNIAHLLELEKELDDEELSSSRSNPLETMSEKEFRQKHRFSKRHFRVLCDWLRTDLTHKHRRLSALSVEQKLSIALRLLARNQIQDDTAWNASTSQSTVSRVFHEVVNVIDRKVGEYIKWPSHAEQKVIANRIFSQWRIPNVVGIIDRAPVKLIRPFEGEDSYVNRKSAHSLNVGAVVDDKLRFLWIDTEWAGSAHDSTIFRESQLYRAFERKQLPGILIGDAAYRAEPCLIKPYPNPDVNSPESAYNKKLCGLRALVEHAFGVTKQQFRILLEIMRYEPKVAVKIVRVCCALRNAFITFREEDSSDDFDDFDDSESIVEFEANQNLNAQQGNRGTSLEGKALMDSIVRDHFT